MILIDGHNVFFALDKDKGPSFEKDLNRWKAECLRLCQAKAKPFILVLDGSGGSSPYGSTKPIGSLGKLVMSGNLTADEWLENWIIQHKQDMVELISADKRLYEKVNFKRVKRLDPVQWWLQLKHSEVNSSSSPSKPSEKKAFGSTDEWLEFFEKN